LAVDVLVSREYEDEGENHYYDSFKRTAEHE
jgi:hypothetical protein